MHHVIVDHWSQGTSPLHARDPRAKIVALLVFLIVLATTAGDVFSTLGFDAILLLTGILIARLPLLNLLLRAAAILPFSVTFAAISFLSGEKIRALALLEKSYLSTVAALLLVATTPLPALLQGLESLGSPRLIVLVIQFLYRYLFVISEQAQHMRLAAACRAGSAKARLASRFRAAAGALAVLFARSYYRAEGIHRAMVARGFAGRFPPARAMRFRMMDAAFAIGVASLIILARTQ